MSFTQTSNRSPRRPPASGPPLGLLGLVAAALFVASIVVGAVLTGQAAPTPSSSDADLVRYVTGHTGRLQVVAMLQLGSAVPLAIYAATASTRLRALGIHVPGPMIGLSGGLLAATFQALSGLSTWVLARAGVAGDHALLRALHDLGFITGGPGEVVFLGLLVAGIAVPALLRGLVPRWLAIAGLGLALVAELSTLTVALAALDPLLAIARFGGLAWLIVVGFRLPVRASALRSRSQSSPGVSTQAVSLPA